MFGDTIMYRQSKQFRRVSGGGAPKPGPPPTLPAPVPTPVVPASYPKNHLTQSHSFSSTGGPPTIDKRKSMPISSAGHSKQQVFFFFRNKFLLLIFCNFFIIQNYFNSHPVSQSLEMV